MNIVENNFYFKQLQAFYSCDIKVCCSNGCIIHMQLKKNLFTQDNMHIVSQVGKS